MKTRIKVSITLCLFIAILTCVSCSYPKYYHDYDELVETVTSVELVKYNNPGLKKLHKKREDVKPLDLNKMEVLEVLQEDQLNAFLEELSGKNLLYNFEFTDSPNGYCLVIRFNDGNFEIIALEVEFSGIFDSQGNIVEFIGSGYVGTGKSFVNKHFNTQI